MHHRRDPNDDRGSLHRLRSDRLDIVLLHINQYPVEAAGEVFDALAMLRDERKIAGFGWSTDHPRQSLARRQRPVRDRIAALRKPRHRPHRTNARIVGGDDRVTESTELWTFVRHGTGPGW